MKRGLLEKQSEAGLPHSLAAIPAKQMGTYPDPEDRWSLTGWVEGKGKRIGTIGKFTAVDTEGNEFGMPVMDKFEYLQKNFKLMQGWVGKIATFKYFERTKAGSYRHPLFKCIRDYE